MLLATARLSHKKPSLSATADVGVSTSIMMKIYCDNGAYPDELKALQKEGSVELIMFKYENKNRHIKSSGQPSSATWKDMKNYTWDNVPGAWDDYNASDKNKEIATIVGLENKRVDILHLDSAYKTKVDAFITNDKDDILFYRDKLEKALGFRFFHTSEIDELVQFVTSANK